MEGTTMKHQLSTIAVLALIAVPVAACGSTDEASGQPVTAVDRTQARVYESDLVSEALAANRTRTYETDVVAKSRADIR
jgi:hypothetical protein